MGEEIYLDNAATTRATTAVSAEVARCLLEDYGNPSSIHRKGIESENIIRNTCASVMSALGNPGGRIVFTSGGTEANNMAISGTAPTGRRRALRIVTSTIEHPSVFDTVKSLEGQGYEPVFAGVSTGGFIRIDELKNLLTDNVALVSIMHVNNETGAIQPVKEIAAVIRSCPHRPVLHVDAVQSFGHIMFRPADLGIDLATLSAHKVHGPKGCGALWIKEGVRVRAILHGGGQQGGSRSGTENVPGIAGFGAACEEIAADPEFAETNLRPIREAYANAIFSSISDSHLLSPSAQVAPHIINVAFGGVKGEVLVRTMGSMGIYVSTGSACSSRKRGPSRVLSSMGVPGDLAEGSIRISLGRFNTMGEVGPVVDALAGAVRRLRGLRR